MKKLIINKKILLITFSSLITLMIIIFLCKNQSNLYFFTGYFLQQPKVTIISPPDGAVVSGVVNISAKVKEFYKIESVNFYINNELKASKKPTGSIIFTYSWNTNNVPEGEYHILVIVEEKFGISYSSSIKVKVKKEYLAEFAVANANNMRILRENEFAVIKKPYDEKLNGNKVLHRFILTTDEEFNQEFNIEIIDGASITIIKGDNETINYVQNTQEVEIYMYDNIDEHIYDEDDINRESIKRIDPAVIQKLEKYEKVPVIIQFNLDYEEFYERYQPYAKIKEKTIKFNEIKANIASILSSKSAIKMDLKIINGISAEIDKKSLEILEKNPYIKKIELDRIYEILLDESVNQIGATEIWQSADIGGNPLTGFGIRIAILDTGVDYTHPDLGGCIGPKCKVIGGYDFVNNDSDPMDDNGHGTHVASICCGKGITANGQPLFGVAPDAKILAYKVCDKYGKCMGSYIISAIEHAIDPNRDGSVDDRVDVISMSLGGDGNPDDSLSLSVDKASKMGVVSVIAAGNKGPSPSTISSPGTARTAITVAASCKKSLIGKICSDPIATFSSRGPLIWKGEDIKKPDIAAPGVNICAARAYAYNGTKPTCFDEHHVIFSGTSMATPHVTGAVALLRQAYPEYSPSQIKKLLKSSATDLGMSYNDQGAGEINLKDILSPHLYIFPHIWVVESNPTVKISTNQQMFSVTPLNKSVDSLNIKFDLNITGINISADNLSINVGNNTTNTFIVKLNIDNDIVKSGTYYGKILLEENGITKGVIHIIINVKPTIVVIPTFLDYGVSNPDIPEWSSNRIINIKNMRADISQTVYFNYSFNYLDYWKVIKLQIPSSVVIQPNTTIRVNTKLIVNNSALPNDIYKGEVLIYNNLNFIKIPVNFTKFYVLHLIEINQQKSFKYNAILHNRKNEVYYFYMIPSNFSIYLKDKDIYDIIFDCSYITVKTGKTYLTFIFKENITVNTSETYLYYDCVKEPENIIDIKRTYYNNLSLTTDRELDSLYLHFFFSGRFLTFHAYGKDIIKRITHFKFSNFSSNYTIYISSGLEHRDNPIHYFNESILNLKETYIYTTILNSLNSSIEFIYKPENFKTITIKSYVYPLKNTDYTLLSLCPIIKEARPGRILGCSSFLKNLSDIKNLSNISNINGQVVEKIYLGVTQYPETQSPIIRPVLRYEIYPFGFSSNFAIKEYLNETWIRFFGHPNKIEKGSIQILPPIINDTIYNLLGPCFWAMKFYNSEKNVSIQSYFIENVTVPVFVCQDYTIKYYNNRFPFYIYSKDKGSLVYNYSFPPFQPFSQPKRLVPVSLPREGEYEFLTTFYYKIKGENMRGDVRAVFNTSRSDPNPPAIKRLYYFTGGERSETYNPNFVNVLEFELDPVGGKLKKVNVSYSTDGEKFVPLNLSEDKSVYSVILPTIKGISKITLQIFGIDDSNNSLFYIFELPVEDQLSQKLDTIPPNVTILYPHNISTVKDLVRIIILALDNSPIRKVEIYINNKLKKTIYRSIYPFVYMYVWNTRVEEDGLYNITVKVHDIYGNIGNNYAEVYVKNR